MRYLLSICLLLLLSARPAFAETITDKEHGFSLDLPADWHQMSDDEMAKINANAEHFHYFYGARSNNGATPYMLINIWPKPNGDLADHLDEIRGGAAKRGMMNAVVTYDSRRAALVMQAQMVGPLGLSDDTSYGFVGSSEIVQVNCYSLAGSSGTNQVAFEQLADSFKFDSWLHLPRELTPTMEIWIGAGVCLLIGGMMVVGIVRKGQPAEE